MCAAVHKMSEPDPSDKSRQKSCNACVRSKRRCDKRTPRCTRCAEKNFSCVYQNLPPPPATGGSPDDPLRAMDLGDSGDRSTPFDFNTLNDSTPASSSSSSVTAKTTTTAAAAEAAEAVETTYFDGDFSTLLMAEAARINHHQQPEVTATDTAAAAAAAVVFDDIAMPNFDFNSVMDFLNAEPTQGGEMLRWETPQPPILPKAMAPELQEIESPCFGVQIVPICDGINAWQVHDPTSRLGYMASFFKDVHVSFTQTKQAPFMHRYLYRDMREPPRPLMVTYTALAAYAGCTDANKEWVFRAICDAAAEVLGTDKDDSAAMTGHVRLARTQALWLIQTVRCFDGDIALRAQAERDMGVLEKWLGELEALRDNVDDLVLLDEPALRRRQPRSWELWIFNESVRRTVLMVHIFSSFYELLKGGDDIQPNVPHWMKAHHMWTFSRHLWDARSSPAFFSAWRDKPFFLVNSFFVQEVGKVARPADVDDFARLLLTVNFGVEETKHFMLEVGA